MGNCGSRGRNNQRTKDSSQKHDHSTHEGDGSLVDTQLIGVSTGSLKTKIRDTDSMDSDGSTGQPISLRRAVSMDKGETLSKSIHISSRGMRKADSLGKRALTEQLMETKSLESGSKDSTLPLEISEDDVETARISVLKQEETDTTDMDTANTTSETLASSRNVSPTLLRNHSGTTPRRPSHAFSSVPTRRKSLRSDKTVEERLLDDQTDQHDDDEILANHESGEFSTTGVKQRPKKHRGSAPSASRHTQDAEEENRKNILSGVGLHHELSINVIQEVDSPGTPSSPFGLNNNGSKRSSRRASFSSVSSTDWFSEHEDSSGSNSRGHSKRRKRRPSLRGSNAIEVRYVTFRPTHDIKVPVTVTTDTYETGKHVYGDKTYRYINQYHILDNIGKGAYGRVRLGVNRVTEQPCAIKIMSKSALKKKRISGGANALADARREILLFKRLEHPNIVKLYEVIDSPSHDKLYLIMEICSGGPMYKQNKMKALEDDIIRRYMRDLILGLEYLHTQHVIHRDIKPENLLLSKDGTLKISDFGVSELVFEDEMIRKTAGTPAFLAPEICSGDSFHGPGVDIWAAGITLYVMMYGRVPFRSGNIPAMYTMIKEAPIELITERHPDLVNLLLGMLDRDVTKRSTIKDLREHPFITNNGMDPLPEPDYIQQDNSALSFTESAGDKQLANRYTRQNSNGSVIGDSKRSPSSLSNPDSDMSYDEGTWGSIDIEAVRNIDSETPYTPGGSRVNVEALQQYHVGDKAFGPLDNILEVQEQNFKFDRSTQRFSSPHVIREVDLDQVNDIMG